MCYWLGFLILAADTAYLVLVVLQGCVKYHQAMADKQKILSEVCRQANVGFAVAQITSAYLFIYFFITCVTNL